MSKPTDRGKNGTKAPFTSNTVAPPADAPSLNLKNDHGELTIRPARLDPSSSSRIASSSHHSSSSSRSVSRPLDSSSRHASFNQPSSHDILDRGTRNATLPTIRENDPPPAYKTMAMRNSSVNKAPTVGGHGNPSALKLDGLGKSAIASSSHGSHNSRYVSSREKQNSYPIDKKVALSSSSSRQNQGGSSRHSSDHKSIQNHAQINRQPSTPSASARQGSHLLSGSVAGHSSHYSSQHGGSAAATARVKTENYKVGDMNRTFLEGMVPASANSASQAQRSMTRSMAPPNAKSILTNAADIAMAKRQTQITSLKPSERAEQERWAQSMIQRSGSCPEGFDWRRIHDGYQCMGGFHVISDELLAEGRGGVYALLFKTDPNDRWGPYYATLQNPNVFVYGGPLPMPDDVPATFKGSGNRHPVMGMGPASMGVHGPSHHGPSYQGPSIHGPGFHGSGRQTRFGRGPSGF